MLPNINKKIIKETGRNRVENKGKSWRYREKSCKDKKMPKWKGNSKKGGS